MTLENKEEMSESVRILNEIANNCWRNLVGRDDLDHEAVKELCSSYLSSQLKTRFNSVEVTATQPTDEHKKNGSLVLQFKIPLDIAYRLAKDHIEEPCHIWITVLRKIPKQIHHWARKAGLKLDVDERHSSLNRKFKNKLCWVDKDGYHVQLLLNAPGDVQLQISKTCPEELKADINPDAYRVQLHELNEDHFVRALAWLKSQAKVKEWWKSSVSATFELGDGAVLKYVNLNDLIHGTSWEAIHASNENKIPD